MNYCSQMKTENSWGCDISNNFKNHIFFCFLHNTYDCSLSFGKCLGSVCLFRIGSQKKYFRSSLTCQRISGEGFPPR